MIGIEFDSGDAKLESWSASSGEAGGGEGIGEGEGERECERDC